MTEDQCLIDNQSVAEYRTIDKMNIINISTIQSYFKLVHPS